MTRRDLLKGLLSGAFLVVATHDDAWARRKKKKKKKRRRDRDEEDAPADPPADEGEGGTEAAAEAPAPPPVDTGPKPGVTIEAVEPVEGSVLRGGGRVDFDEAMIRGQTVKSGAVYLFQRKDSALSSMVERRKTYRKELKRLFEQW